MRRRRLFLVYALSLFLLFGLTDMNLFSGYTTVGDAALYAIGRHCPNLATLDLSLCVAISDDGLSALVGSAAADGPLSFSSCGGGARQLTSLGLRYTNVTDKTLFCLAANCHQLAHLDLKGIDNVERK
jgi:hypothetical protein